MINIPIKASGNHLFFGQHILTVFDPTGSHGAENALLALKELKKPMADADCVLESLDQLCADTLGQFEIMNHGLIISL